MPHTQRHKGTQTHPHTDTQANRHIGTQTHTHTPTHRHTGTQARRHTCTHAHAHGNRKAESSVSAWMPCICSGYAWTRRDQGTPGNSTTRTYEILYILSTSTSRPSSLFSPASPFRTLASIHATHAPTHTHTHTHTNTHKHTHTHAQTSQTTGS